MRELRRAGLSQSGAAKLAEKNADDQMRTLAALHEPDSGSSQMRV